MGRVGAIHCSVVWYEMIPGDQRRWPVTALIPVVDTDYIAKYLMWRCVPSISCLNAVSAMRQWVTPDLSLSVVTGCLHYSLTDVWNLWPITLRLTTMQWESSSVLFICYNFALSCVLYFSLVSDNSYCWCLSGTLSTFWSNVSRQMRRQFCEVWHVCSPLKRHVTPPR